MKRIWIKLWTEILEDDEFNTLPEFMRWRAVQLFLIAGTTGDDGKLPPVSRLAWRLRLDESKVEETLSALTLVGVVHQTPDGCWFVTHFAQRQEAMDGAERTRIYRERLKERDGDVTKRHINCDEGASPSSYSISPSVSPDDEGGAGGENSPERIFTDILGRFYGEREKKRWMILVEAVGLARAHELVAWAAKKEIQLVNRPSLLDSLETAAKRWTEPKAPSRAERGKNAHTTTHTSSSEISESDLAAARKELARKARTRGDAHVQPV